MSGGLWHITGTAKQYAPASGVGTATLGPGEVVLFVVAHASQAGATVSILGGVAIAIPNGAAPTTISFAHSLMQVNSGNGGTVVFTNTDQAFVHSVRLGNTPS